MSWRVVAVHSRYMIRGGEDVSHETEVGFLRRSGCDVVNVEFDNRDLVATGRAGRALKSTFNVQAYRRVSRTIREFSPDVVYINNIFPAASRSVLTAARLNQAPTVRVLRNYRLCCASGTFFRDGAECYLCTRSSIHGLRHNCRGALGESSLVVANIGLDRIRRGKSWRSEPVEYVAVSPYVREAAIASGVPADSITLRPNLFLPSPHEAKQGVHSHDYGFTFLGRDVPEKGLATFVSAARTLPDVTFTVLGSVVTGMSVPGNLTVMGEVDYEKALSVVGRSTAVIVPSHWREPFGRVVLEALGMGIPVIASNVGAALMLSEETRAVRTFAARDVEGLVQIIREIDNLDAASYTAVREEARTCFSRDFSPESWLRITHVAFERARSRWSNL